MPWTKDEPRPRLWGLLYWASIGTGLLLKGLIGALFPFASAFLFLLFTKQLLVRETWRRLAPFWGILLLLAIAAPWHILATLRNPPYFFASLNSGPGNYHGFFWFYFFNEHILRFLNRRFPHDYDTVPRLYFWLFQLLWLFPWSVYFPALFRLNYRAHGSRIAYPAYGPLLDRFSDGVLQLIVDPGILFHACLSGNGAAAGLRDGIAKRWSDAEDRPRFGELRPRCGPQPAPQEVYLHLSCRACGGFAHSGRHFSRRSLSSKNPQEYTLSLGHMGDLTLSLIRLSENAFDCGRNRVRNWHRRLIALKSGKRFVGVSIMMVLFF